MAFAHMNLSVLAYANNFTLWHYTTTDKYTTLIEDGYFDTAVKVLRTNDLIIANTNTDDGPKTVFLIAKNENGKVSVTQY